MALTISQEQKFKRWMVKSLSGSALALSILGYGWVTSTLADGIHLLALGCVIFGGFPLWNMIFESDKLPMAIYYSLQILIIFGIQFVRLCNPSLIEPIIPPIDILFCSASWLLADLGLGILFPHTHHRLIQYKLWREKTLQELVSAHY